MDNIQDELVGDDISPKFREAVELNQILRGELSAVEAYDQVMKKVKKDPEAVRLRSFLDDHQQAFDYWKKQVEDDGVVPDTTSGPWGVAVEAFVGTAKLLGNTSALKALKEGEEHGLNEYRDLLENPDVTPAHKVYIRDVLVPNQERHIDSLSAMLKMQ